MKGFPKGWKPPKKKFAKAPTPPPSFPHTPKTDYKRSDKRREIEEAMSEDEYVGTAPCSICGKVIEADKALCPECEEEGELPDGETY